MNTASVLIKPQSVVAVIHLGYFELLPPHSQQAISNQHTFESICSLFCLCFMDISQLFFRFVMFQHLHFRCLHKWLCSWILSCWYDAILFLKRAAGQWLSADGKQPRVQSNLLLFLCVCALQLGQAVTKNPGYLKLRRIRAAQNIAKTVRQTSNKEIIGWLMLTDVDTLLVKYFWYIWSVFLFSKDALNESKMTLKHL